MAGPVKANVLFSRLAESIGVATERIRFAQLTLAPDGLAEWSIRLTAEQSETEIVGDFALLQIGDFIEVDLGMPF